MATCKGQKRDGSPCGSPIVLKNGYCRAHQDQAAEAAAPQEPIRWTRERLEAAIGAHGGPEGLDLAGADLSDLSLRKMDLHGIVLDHWDKDSKSSIGANLQGADLFAANLQHAIADDVNLQGAILASANLQGVKLLGANLRETNLEGADLGLADLRCANLQEAILRKANLQQAHLGCANLQGAILREASLQGARLGAANLQEADLEQANLQEVFLAYANLQGVKLWDANLRGANLLSVDLQETRPRGAKLEKLGLVNSDLQGANLECANLQGVTLAHANLQGANLNVANLRRANLRYANLQGTALVKASLQEADLRHADLREVDLLNVRKEGLWEIRLYRARLDRTLLERKQLGPRIGDEQAGEYREARDTYLALKQNFEDLGDYEAASWSYIKERQMEKACSAPWRARRFYGWMQLGDTDEHRVPGHRPRVWWFFVRHTAKWLSDGFVEGLCGYGESIGRVLGWMTFLLFIGGPLLFGLLGLLDWPDKNAEIFFRLSVPWRYVYAYMQQLLYVFDAFTTANFAELEPANDLARLLSGFIALLGIFLTGLLGFVAGNRIRRS